MIQVMTPVPVQTGSLVSSVQTEAVGMDYLAQVTRQWRPQPLRRARAGSDLETSCPGLPSAGPGISPSASGATVGRNTAAEGPWVHGPTRASRLRVLTQLNLPGSASASVSVTSRRRGGPVAMTDNNELADPSDAASIGDIKFKLKARVLAPRRLRVRVRGLDHIIPLNRRVLTSLVCRWQPAGDA